MNRPGPQPTRFALAIAASLAASAADAVTINHEGLGQALIFPYYTVRSPAGGNAFNTYLSVVNHAGEAKAVRVRIREGRAARPVLDFNLYLSPNDVWTGAIIPFAGTTPSGDGARLITADKSCTDPAFASIDLRTDGVTGANADGFGEAAERTREGYVEMIEMATLTGTSAVAVTHNSAGVPSNCAAIRTGTPLVAAPTGGLSGTLTLINVNNGQDFTVNAEALADLSTRPFYRQPSDAYPDFAAVEIDPVSVIHANGQLYRSAWSRPQDAVSAVMMRTHWLGEYVLDAGTASLTDVVATLPTRHHYVGTGVSPPFEGRPGWSPACGTVQNQAGHPFGALSFNREERGIFFSNCSEFTPGIPFCSAQICASAAVASVYETIPPDVTLRRVLGSETRGMGAGGVLRVVPGFENGWFSLVPQGVGTLTSLPSSTRTDLATGQLTTGPHTYRGLPVVGFVVRTFTNGTLSCGAGACQGNYGGAFPFKYRRTISPP